MQSTIRSLPYISDLIAHYSTWVVFLIDKVLMGPFFFPSASEATLL